MINIVGIYIVFFIVNMKFILKTILADRNNFFIGNQLMYHYRIRYGNISPELSDIIVLCVLCEFRTCEKIMYLF